MTEIGSPTGPGAAAAAGAAESGEPSGRAANLRRAANSGDWEQTRTLLQQIDRDARAGTLPEAERRELATVLPEVQQKAEAADNQTFVKVLLFILGILPGLIAVIVDAASTSDEEATADAAKGLTDRFGNESRPSADGTPAGQPGQPSRPSPAAPPALDRAALQRTVDAAKQGSSDGGATITPAEARTLLTNRGGGSVHDARQALAAMDLDAASRANLEAALTVASFAERLSGVPATLPESAYVNFSGRRTSKVRRANADGSYTDVGADLVARMNRAKTALSRTPPDVQAAIREFRNAPGAEGLQAYSSGAFGNQVTMAQCFEALGLPAEMGQAYAQLRVLAEMEQKIGRTPAMPPSAADLSAYGRAMRRSTPAALGAAFERYALAFNVHIGNRGRDIEYPDNGSAADAIPPNRTVRADGRAVQDCDGFALLGSAFFGGAGYRSQYVMALPDGNSSGHRMLWLTKSGQRDGILVSNDEVTTGRTRTRNTMIGTALSSVPGMDGSALYFNRTFTNSDPRH